MTEEIIIKELFHFFANYDYKLSNTFIYLWESDFFCISTSGYAIEVEVKISKSDFKADFKKTQKHHILKNGNKSHVVIPGHETSRIWDNEEKRYFENKSSEVTFIPSMRPNKFFYCCPENLISAEDVPDYAGLLYFKQEKGGEWNYRSIIQAKTAKFIHKDKLDLSKILLQKYYYMSMDLKSDLSLLRDRLNSMSEFFEYKDDYDRKLKTRIFEDLPYFQPSLFEIKPNNIKLI